MVGTDLLNKEAVPVVYSVVHTKLFMESGKKCGAWQFFIIMFNFYVYCTWKQFDNIENGGIVVHQVVAH